MNARLRHFLPFLSWPRPTASQLRADGFAGLTVGLMLLPQAIAYAALAGMPLQTGLYSAILPLVVATLFASSTRLGVGPTALSSLMIFAALAPMAEPGSAHWVMLAIWLALLAGGMQIALGLARMDWLMGVITMPVLSGFTQASALLIMASQVPALTGISRQAWQHIGSAGQLWHALQGVDVGALLFGAAGIGMLRLTRRHGAAIPWAALLLALGALVSYGTDYAARGGAVVGDLQVQLHGLQWPGWPGMAALAELALPALVIALMSFVEVATSAKTEHALAGTQWRAAQDLIAQGLAKISSGLSGGFSTSASLSRSAINHYAGAVSGWSNLICAAVVAIAALWLTPLLRHVPMALLAAVVVTGVMGLIRPRMFRQYWSFSRMEAVIALTTLVVTLATAPRLYWGVLAGLLLNLIYFMYQRLHPRIVEVGVYPEDGRLRDRHLWGLPPLCAHVLALRLDASLDFATAAALEQRATTVWEANPQLHSLCLVASGINNIDATGLETLNRLRALVARRKGKLYLSGMKLPLEQRLQKAGFLADTDHVQVLKTDAQTIEVLTQLDRAGRPAHMVSAQRP